MTGPLSRWFFALVLPAAGLQGAPPPDPAAPRFAELAEQPAPDPAPFDRLRFHQAPKPRAADAVNADWPRFLGPGDNATSPETGLLRDLPKEGPARVWEVRKGDGYASPAIVGEFLVLFHALDGRETVECLHPETGRRYWLFDYPIQYRDRYGFANGPRGSPVIVGGRVVTHGVTSVLTCLDLKTGRLAWQRDLRKEFHVPQDFFGQGGTPLVLDGRVIVNVGGKDRPVPEDDTGDRMAALALPGLSVAAFDLRTGRLAWGLRDTWGASYASPMPAPLHGKTKVLVFAGGESNPPTGGLLCIDPADGGLHHRFPWRADDYISATAQSPTVIPGSNQAFISTAYPKGRPLGGILLEFDPKFQAREVWRSGKIALHWMNPIVHEGHLYAIDGETEQASQLVCVEASSGAEKWRRDLRWEDEELSRRQGGRPASLGILRASLLRVDGRVLCLGETGTLLWLDLSPADARIESRAQLFYAPHTWCLPAVSRGLLYVMQNEREMVRDSADPRIICFDLRK